MGKIASVATTIKLTTNEAVNVLMADHISDSLTPAWPDVFIYIISNCKLVQGPFAGL